MSSNKFSQIRPVTHLSHRDQVIQSLFAEDLSRWMPQPLPERLPTVTQDQRKVRLGVSEKTTVKLQPMFGLSHPGGLLPHLPSEKRKTVVDCSFMVKIQPRKAQRIEKLPPIPVEKAERKQHGASEWDTASKEELLCARRTSEEEKQASEAFHQSFSPKVHRYRDRVRSAEVAWRQQNHIQIETDAVLVNQSDEELWEFMILMEEENKDIQLYEAENNKFKEKLEPMEENVQVTTRLIEKKLEEQKKLRKVQELQKIDQNQETLWAKRNKLLYELITEVHNSLGIFGCPSFPFIMLQHLQDWCYDQNEFIQSQELRKAFRQHLKGIESRERQEKQMELEALREERRQRRLERALSPPVKRTGRKLMPRSRPPKPIKIAEAVKSNSEEEDAL